MLLIGLCYILKIRTIVQFSSEVWICDAANNFVWVTIVDLIYVLPPWQYIRGGTDTSIPNHKVSPLDVAYFDVINSLVHFFVVIKQRTGTRAK